MKGYRSRVDSRSSKPAFGFLGHPGESDSLSTDEVEVGVFVGDEVH